MLTQELVKEILENIDNQRYRHTDRAYGTAYDLVDEWGTDLEYYNPLLEEDVYSLIWESTGEEFMYYADAFDYLQKNHIYNFQDAINSGYDQSVSAIATYYFEEEVIEILSDAGLFELF